MAAVMIQISGVLYDKLSRTERPVLLQGSGSLIGVGVGGGPIEPGQPPSDAHPEHPIYYPPGSQPHPEHPIYWPPGSQPHPEHPIVIPPDVPPDMPAPPDLFDWKTAWIPPTEPGGDGHWVVVAIPTFDHPAPAAAKAKK